MDAMSMTSDKLSEVMRASVSLTELQHTRLHLRAAHVLLAATMMFDMFDPATYILTAPISMMYRIASLSGSPEMVAWSFVALGLLMAPYLFMQIFCSDCRGRREITKLACFALLGAGLQWVFLAWLSRNLDYEAVTGVLFRTGIGAVAYSLTLAYALNAEAAQRVRTI